MLLAEKRLRTIVREMLLNEAAKPKKIVIKLGDARVFSNGKFRISQYDPTIRQINKLVDQDKKNYTMKVLNQLTMTFFKNKKGELKPVAAKGDNPYKNISDAYFSYAEKYASTGDTKISTDHANMSMISDITDDDKPSGPKALVRKDPNDPGKGYKIVSIGLTKDAEVPSVGFKNAVIGGKKVSGEVSLSDIFKDVYLNDKLLKVGSGQKWIKGDKSPEAQMEWIQVKTLQGLLISAGYAKGLFTKTDGDFGPNTKKAVERFQRALKLKVDGKVGQQTASALNPKVVGKNIPITGMGKLSAETLKKLGITVEKKGGDSESQGEQKEKAEKEKPKKEKSEKPSA